MPHLVAGIVQHPLVFRRNQRSGLVNIREDRHLGSSTTGIGGDHLLQTAELVGERHLALVIDVELIADHQNRIILKRMIDHGELGLGDGSDLNAGDFSPQNRRQGRNGDRHVILSGSSA